MQIDFAIALIWFGAFLFSTTVHEAMHAFAAWRLREMESNAMMSMVGLIVAWRVFPLVTDPLFAALLRLLHPFDSYS